MKIFLKNAWQYPILALWFVISLLFFESFLNRGNTDLAKEMNPSTLPIICARYEGHDANRLYGYSNEMNYSLIRDGITPMETGRKVSFRVYKYDTKIEGISYKLLSVDKERYVEEGTLEGYAETSDYIDLNLQFKDIIKPETEYSLLIDITMPQDRHAYYYSRVLSNDSLLVNEKIDYVYYFNECTFDKDKAEVEITKYLESNSSGDNTDFSHVNIHSSLDTVTWGSLNVKKHTEPVCTIEEIDEKSATMKLDYVIEALSGEENNKRYYNVSEVYRFIKGTDRMYLLDFDRYMDTILLPSNGVVYNDKLMLGITPNGFDSMESENGNVYSFVINGSLFAVNSKTNRFQTIYSFYNEDNMDPRDLNTNHDIMILNIDESDNILFCVYGYFNRGDHEGECGVNLLEYDAKRNIVTEILFVASDDPYEIMKHDIEKLAYYDSINNFYFYMNNRLYQAFADSYESTVLVDNLKNDELFVSPSQANIAWVDSKDQYGMESIKFMRLDDGYEFSIQAFKENRLNALGFMGEDLICGKLNTSDVSEDVFGDKIYPMYEVDILNNKNDVIKSYVKENIYVTGCRINENLITLTRVEKDENNEMIPTSPDSIVNNKMEKEVKNLKETVATENMKKIIQVALKNEMDNKKTKYQTPKIELFEGSRDIIPAEGENEAAFYVFKGEACLAKYNNAAKAVNYAELSLGCVIDQDGHYIWKKQNLRKVNQIMKLAGGNIADDESASLEECIETILGYEGYSLNIKDSLLRGKSPAEIITDNVPSSTGIELAGCTSDTIKYYLNSDIPVIALAGNNSVLIVGYSESVYVWLNPQTGNLMKVGKDEAEKFYEKYGYRFVTYQKWDS